ncbi:MAG TPA: cell division protein ZapE [Candidatus Azoamicus sp.]
MSILIDLYRLNLNDKKILYDKSQEAVVLELADLFERLKLKNIQKDSIFFSEVFSFFKKDSNLGLYIWGDVGRGKTYLVDLFFYSLPFEKKVRFHYHHFMKIIHERLKMYSGEKDPIKVIAKFFYKEYSIICLDEFFVKDIGDAMNLSRLFHYLFEFGVFFVMTSNVVPHMLYEGGLQRQKFLPTIVLLEKFLKIVCINSTIDYRFMYLSSERLFFYSLNFSTFKSMKKLFLNVAKNSPKKKVFLIINGRNIVTQYVADNIVWFDFKNICGFGRSHLDYCEIATLFKIVFISGIKKIVDEDDARRFIALIDEFYDRKINVVISFECAVSNLYKGDLLKFDFKRTISRLNEMSTKDYLKNLS